MNFSPILISYLDEIKDNLKSFEDFINNINNNNSDYNKCTLKIEELIKFIESDISALKLEFNNSYSNLDINKDQNIKPVFQKYDQLKQQYNKIKLLGNGSGSNNNCSNNKNNSITYRDSNGKLITVTSNGSTDSKDRIARLNKIHENNLQMINDCKREISNMTNIAIDTNLELRRQTEQMRNMEKKFDEIDSSLNQSNKTVDKMLKRWF